MPSLSAQLEGAERKNGAQDADDPEPDHHLRLRPPFQFEVMVQRGPQEHAMLLGVLHPVLLAPVLEHRSLQNHRHGFREEHRPYEEQQELTLEENGDRPYGAAEGQRARVAHEHLRRMRVVPKEADAGAHDRRTEHGEFTGG